MAKDFILKLKQKPEFIFELLLPTLVDYGVVSKETTGIMKMYGANFVKSESFANMLDSLAEFIEYFGKSTSGQRMVSLLPEILAADSTDAIMGIFQREAETSWSEFISMFLNFKKLIIIFIRNFFYVNFTGTQRARKFKRVQAKNS